MLNPAIFRLLGPIDGKSILDAGCGHGYLCRLLAQRGALATGVEPAGVPFEYARRRERAEPLGVQYLQRDLSRLGETDAAFDAVANMVLLDIPDSRLRSRTVSPPWASAGPSSTPCTTPCWVPGHFERWAARGTVEIAEYLNEYIQDFDGIARNFTRIESAFRCLGWRMRGVQERAARPPNLLDIFLELGSGEGATGRPAPASPCSH